MLVRSGTYEESQSNYKDKEKASHGAGSFRDGVDHHDCAQRIVIIYNLLVSLVILSLNSCRTSKEDNITKKLQRVLTKGRGTSKCTKQRVDKHGV